MSTVPIVAVILTVERATTGLLDTLTLFEKTYPTTTLQFYVQVVDGTAADTARALENFLTLYPASEYPVRVTVSDTTTSLVTIAGVLAEQGLTASVPSFSVSASSNAAVGALENVLTLGYFSSTEAISSFLVYTDYHLKNGVTVLYEDPSVDAIYIQEMKSILQTQCALLTIPYREAPLVVGGESDYALLPNSSLIILCDTFTLPLYVTPAFLVSVPDGCYIQLSDLNFNLPNSPFGSIPAFVPIPTPINFTATSLFLWQQVLPQSNFKYYGIFAFWDILVTLNFLAVTSVPITITNFTSVNPFNETPAAWVNSASYDVATNGIDDGTYDWVFTDNLLLQGPCAALYDQYYQGGIMALPTSQSVFRTLGLVSFYHSPFYYVQQNLQKVFSQNKELLFCSFEKSIINYPTGTQIFTNIAEVVGLHFFYAVESGGYGYFTTLVKINDLCLPAPKVNATMSKRTVRKVVCGAL